MRMIVDKRVLWTTIVFICIAGFTTFLGLFCLGGYLAIYGPPDSSKYTNYGRDYVTHFGEGRFAVLRFPKGRCLYDRDTGQTLLSDVSDWRESGDFAYISSSDAKYVIIQTISSEYWEYARIDDIPAEHQAQSRKLRVSR